MNSKLILRSLKLRNLPSNRFISSSSIKFAPNDERVSSGSDLILNFSTPATTIYKSKIVDKVMLPSETGEYGVTANHSPIIAQLTAGVVTINHTSGESEQFFIPGGFAITHANSVTDVSVTEAFPLADFDADIVKASYDAAVKAKASATDDATIATYEIQIKTFSILARTLNVSI